MDSISVNATFAFLFGALHALEPGHGKTALFTYIASGERSMKEGMVISVSSALTHTIAVFVLAFLSHGLMHHAGVNEGQHGIHRVLALVSGLIICGIGVRIMIRNKTDASSHTCGACHGGEKQSDSENTGKDRFLTSGLLGIATGLIPCPSVVVAYLSGVSTGDSLVGLKSVVLFGLGMCLSLMAVIALCRICGKKIVERIKLTKFKSNWSLIQGSIFIVIGLFTTFIH